MGSLIEARGVTRSFATDGGVRIEVLRGIDLSVPAGGSLALVGPSGSGKSTLLEILGALDRPDGGEVWLDDQELGALPEPAREALRGRRIGFVFQQALLLPQLTAIENVLTAAWAIGSVTPYREAARRLLDRVGLGARLHHRPSQLSGGECQRVALARALLLQPDLLLADEPTGSVDAAVAGQLADLLCALQWEQRTTLVVATHAPEIAARMSRTMRLREGRLAPP
jgi:putative ABC transport system ATP-binding protein